MFNLLKLLFQTQPSSDNKEQSYIRVRIDINLITNSTRVIITILIIVAAWLGVDFAFNPEPIVPEKPPANVDT